LSDEELAAVDESKLYKNLKELVIEAHRGGFKPENSLSAF